MSTLISKQLADHLKADSTLTSLVGTNIYNGEPEQDTPLPLLIINRGERDTEDGRTLNGNSFLARYTYTIDAYASGAAEVEQLADAVKASVDGFSGGNIEQCTHQRDYRNDDDNGYRVTMELEVWGDDAAIVPTSSGIPAVEVRADGLYFNDEKIGNAADVDLTSYARTDEPNTFTQPQTLTAKVIVSGGDGTPTKPDLSFGNPNTTNPIVKWNPTNAQTGLIFYSGNNQICRLQDNGACVFASFSTIGGMNIGDWFVCRGTPNQSAQITFGSVETPTIHCQNLGNQASTTTLQATSGNVNSCAFVAKATVSQAADTVQVQSSTGGKQFAITPTGSIQTNQTAAATTLGNVVGKLPIYDEAGTLRGYLPIYDNIT